MTSLKPPIVHVDQRTQYITITPSTGHSATVIFSHGLGDTAQGWADTMAQVGKSLNHIKFILPTATAKPVTLNMGMRMPSWYDIKSLTDRADDTCDGIEDSRKILTNLIATEIANGILPSRIVLGGFSQGGALAIYTGFQRTDLDPLAGLLVLSGYLPNRNNFKMNEIAKNTPMLMCHGDSDQVVRLSWAELSVQALREAQASEIEWKIFPGMEHSACMEEINYVTKWLGRILPPCAEIPHNLR